MYSNMFKQVGMNIQDILTERGLTQQFLADELGVSKQVMSKILAGNKAINVYEIRRIGEILSVSSEVLLNTEEEQEEIHHFDFMGKVRNDETKEKIRFLQGVIDEIVMLEEYDG